jgi:hypothetical protein
MPHCFKFLLNPPAARDALCGLEAHEDSEYIHSQGLGIIKRFEQDGIPDLDCELKFYVYLYNAEEYQNDAIKIYRALASMHQQRNVRYLSFAKMLPAIHINLPNGSDASAVLNGTVSSFIGL